MLRTYLVGGEPRFENPWVFECFENEFKIKIFAVKWMKKVKVKEKKRISRLEAIYWSQRPYKALFMSTLEDLSLRIFYIYYYILVLKNGYMMCRLLT